MNTAIVYHQVKPGVDCPDGIVSAWIACKKYPRATVFGACYQSESDWLNFADFDHLVLVDFSLSKSRIDWELSEGKKITILDHHQTAWDALSSIESQIHGKIDISGDHCGATLTWEYCFPNIEPPEFLKYIRDRDNWDFRYPQTQAIHEAFSKLRSLCPNLFSKFAFFEVLATLEDFDITSWLVPIGNELLKPKTEAINKALNRQEFFTFDEYLNMPFIRLQAQEERLTSDICMRMYQDFDSPFVACVMSDNQTFSLRSNKWTDNFDVSAIAQRFGGGGHRNAAGFKLDTPINENTTILRSDNGV